MNFLYPAFLFGLFLISIPILIHLFNFRKATRKYFSNVAFLKEVQLQTHKRSRLKHYLILLCRVLAVSAIVLAFAQPFIPVEDTIQSSGKTLLYLDNSFSMNLEEGENSFLNNSKDFIAELTEFLPEASDYLLWTSDNTSSVPKLKSAVQNQLLQTDWGYSATTAEEIVQKISQQYKSLDDLEVFVFSDFQHSDSEKLAEAMSDSSIQWNIMPFASEEQGNVFIDSIWMDNPLILVNESSTLHFRIKNSGNQFKKLKATLSVDGQALGKIQEEIEGGDFVDISYNVVFEDGGNHQGKLEIEDFPLFMDNEFFFNITIPEKYVVSIVSDEKNNLIQKVYASEENFKVHGFLPGNFDYNTLEESDLLILDLGSGISASFIDYAFNKFQGDVVVLPGKGVRQLPFAGRLQSYSDSTALAIDLPEKENSFLRGIFSTYRKDISLPSVKVDYRIKGVETLIPLENGLPFLAVDQNLESGRSIYYFSSSLKSLKQNFLKNAFSIPVFYKCLLLSKNIENPSYYTLGNSTVTVEMADSLASDSKLEIQLKDSLATAPFQSVQGRSVLLSLASIEEPGQYQLTESGSGNVVQTIALNVPKKESLLKFADIEALKALLAEKGNVKFFSLEGMSSTEFFQAQNSGTPLWKYFIVFAIIFLLAEMAIIKWYKE